MLHFIRNCNFMIAKSYYKFSNKVYYSSLNGTKIYGDAIPLAKIIDDIQEKYIDPLLKEKTNFSSRNEHDSDWTERDKNILKAIQNIILNDSNLLPIINLNTIIDGLIIHVENRKDVLSLNKDRIRPENGPLIRNIYNFIDNNQLCELIASLQKHQIIKDDDLITKAYFCSEFRRLIRKIVRVAASQDNVNLASIHSLKDAVFSLTEQCKEPLESWGIYHLVVNYKNHGNEKHALELEKFFDDGRNYDQCNLAPEVFIWMKKYCLGLNFNDLEQKYINRRAAMTSSICYQEVWRKIVENSTTTNVKVNKQMLDREPTKITQRYLDGMLKTGLGSVFSTSNFFSIQSRGVHSSSSLEISRLENIFYNRILKEPIIWHRNGIRGLTANLGDGVTADLYVGAEEHDAKIYVSEGSVTISREIPEFWLKNWIKDPDTASVLTIRP